MVHPLFGERRIGICVKPTLSKQHYRLVQCRASGSPDYQLPTIYESTERDVPDHPNADERTSSERDKSGLSSEFLFQTPTVERRTVGRRRSGNKIGDSVFRALRDST